MAQRIESDEDIEFYKDDFNFKVFAGPGAGKTHFLIKNIISTIQNSKKLKTKDRKILCITYTNVAVDEIKNRLGDYSKYVYVSTIHSFLYEYVINPYQQQLKTLIKKIYGITIDKNVKFYQRPEGFGLLSKLKKSEFIDFLKNKYKLLIANDVTKKKLSECIIDLKDINKFPFPEEQNSFPKIKRILGLSDEQALKLKGAIWQKEGVLDFDEILYFSYALLKTFRFISYDIAYTFPYMLIDEYQDTMPIQDEMIKLISSFPHVSIGVVGDIAQSIYGFQGASYHVFDGFKPALKNFKEFVIDGNRRSNQNIVNFLNYVRQSDTKLNQQKCLCNNNTNTIKFVLYKSYGGDILSRISSDCIVLCRRWADAFLYINDIGEEQREILQKLHNYYRYVLDRDMTKDFENNNVNWISQIKLIVNIKEAIQSGDFASILFELSKIFEISLFNQSVKSHNTNEYKEILKIISFFDDINDNMSYYDIIFLLKNKFTSISLKIVNELELKNEDDDNYNYQFTPYLYNLTLRTMKMMVYDIFTEDSKYVTIHKTKGKEYDSVLVNMEPLKDERSLGTIIDVLCDPKIIDENNYVASEFVRIAYVAFSRAKNNLYIHLNTDLNGIKSMVEKLNNYIQENHIDKFYEIIDLN